ncbi:MAG: nsrR [Rickettsiaceae bacterium]|jgi:Rrf2 family nitric oxide-sensitive transcriptional repressor|nr:nsrR [Rickettsiaceae bacterium]
MQLTIFTDYGLRSLMYMAVQPEKKCSVREIAEHYGISRNHLVKVVHHLAKLGYITSSKGKGGGIQLSCDASELRIGDLVKKLEPNMHIVECFNRDTNTCTIVSSCNLKHHLQEANEAFIEVLNKRTLQDTIKNKALFVTKS